MGFNGSACWLPPKLVHYEHCCFFKMHASAISVFDMLPPLLNTAQKLLL